MIREQSTYREEAEDESVRLQQREGEQRTDRDLDRGELVERHV